MPAPHYTIPLVHYPPCWFPSPNCFHSGSLFPHLDVTNTCTHLKHIVYVNPYNLIFFHYAFIVKRNTCCLPCGNILEEVHEEKILESKKREREDGI